MERKGKHVQAAVINLMRAVKAIKQIRISCAKFYPPHFSKFGGNYTNSNIPKNKNCAMMQCCKPPPLPSIKRFHMTSRRPCWSFPNMPVSLHTAEQSANCDIRTRRANTCSALAYRVFSRSAWLIHLFNRLPNSHISAFWPQNELLSSEKKSPHVW